MDTQVLIYKNGLESAMAHAICQGMLADALYDVEWYLNECRSFFVSMGVDTYIIEDMLDEAHSRGVLEYVTGLSIQGVDSGAQIHPASNPVMVDAVHKLVELLSV